MDDMDAFDRQIAREVLETVRPPRHADHLAIFTAITATQSPRWRFRSVFSATKFVVAGAIVALFGGFLLAGVLTQPRGDDFAPAAVTASPAPMTTDELLTGMVTEKVEPGVYRVLSDGVGHDLVAEPPAGVTLAPDGSVWLLRGAPTQDEAELLGRGPRGEVDAVYRLGREGMHVFELSQPSHESRIDVAVDADGVAWVSMGYEPRDEGTLASHDGATWSSPTWPDGSGAVGAIEATTDGAVWVARKVEDGPGPSVARVMDGEWTVLPPLDDPSLEGLYRGPHGSFVAAEDGTAWLANGRMTSGGSEGPGPTGLLHFDGEQWAVVDLPIDGTVLHAGPLALGPDGTLWVYVADHSVSSRPTNHLVRLDADGWTVFSGRSSSFGHTLDEADGVPMLSTSFYYEARMAVDPDGKLWIAVGGDGGIGDPNWLYPPSLDPAPGPIGLLTFDGTSWNQYLKGLHVNRVDVADDGTVFATALYGCPLDTECDPWPEDGDVDMDWSRGGFYVITPEAVAATE